MSDSNLAVAEAYYKAFVDKDIPGIARRLHPEVSFVAPMGESHGRDAVVEAAKRLVPILKGVTIRARFASGDQVVLVYDMTFEEPLSRCRTAAWMTVADGLIARSELFYDARPFGNL